MTRIFLIIFVLTACSERKKSESNTLDPQGLLQSKCLSCHSGQLAPTMQEVRESYLKAYPERESFAKAMHNFVRKPQHYLMTEQVNRYGMMPAVEIEDAELNAIVNYIFENQFETSIPKEGEPIKKAKAIVQTAQSLLGTNLIQAIKQKGAPAAIEFCHLKAIELTDSVSKQNLVALKRITDRPRNPQNQANEWEMRLIAQMKDKLDKKEILEPVLRQETDMEWVYTPIILANTCLQCHGSKEINPQTLTVINNLYPNDKAKKYREGELRGLWVVGIKK